MKKTKLKVILNRAGMSRGVWSGYIENDDAELMVRSRDELESRALAEMSRKHGEGWSVKSVSITFPPLNPTPKTRRAKP